MADWETVIGLEVHAQLKTRGKIFARSAAAYGAEPNALACEFSVALPGTLPALNMEAVRLAVKFGLAIGAQINRRSIFARKHYFYPDLPKGYQISQYESPIVGRGQLTIAVEDRVKTIGVTRAHLEEDAGKSLHQDFQGLSGIDLNRAGTPLLEIVSEPELRSPTEAAAYLKELHALLRYLDISDGNMQEGSLRCDANVSVRKVGARDFGVRVELKNINSFRFVEKAIRYESRRQIYLLEGGGRVALETRLYDSDRDETRAMRGKEQAHDYRYFPDPDLPPLVLDEAFIESARAELPELPAARRRRFELEFGLPARVAAQLTADRISADYFESAARATAATDAKIVANWITGELSAALNRDNLDLANAPVSSSQLAQLLNRVTDGTVSGKIAKEVFAAMWCGEGDADQIIADRGWAQLSDRGELEKTVQDILTAHPQQAQQYRDGKEKVLGFLVGKVMQATGGKANPKQVNEILTAKLRGQLAG